METLKLLSHLDFSTRGTHQGKGPQKADRHGLSLAPLLTQSVTHDLDSPLFIGNCHLDEALRQTFKLCFKFASFVFITAENEL